MKLVDEKYKIRCDMGLCKNMSDVVIEVDDSKRHNIHICKACFEQLYSLMAKKLTPKSVENVVKKAENKRNEWNRNKTR